MTRKTAPQEIDETALDDVAAAGNRLLGHEVTHATGYIGETEKNVWKAPAGVVFEPNDEP